MHGFTSLMLKDENGEPAQVHSCASGLDYQSVGPQHSYLHKIGRVTYVTASDKEALKAFHTLSLQEGIIPALESAHAVAYAIKLANTMKKTDTIIVNLSGRGDKDLDYVLST